MIHKKFFPIICIGLGAIASLEAKPPISKIQKNQLLQKQVEDFFNHMTFLQGNFLQTVETNQGLFQAEGILWMKRPNTLVILVGEQGNRQKLIIQEDDMQISEEKLVSTEPGYTPKKMDLLHTPLRYLLKKNINLSENLESHFKEDGRIVSAHLREKSDHSGSFIELVFTKSPHLVLQGWVMVDGFGNRTTVSLNPASIQKKGDLIAKHLDPLNFEAH